MDLKTNPYVFKKGAINEGTRQVASEESSVRSWVTVTLLLYVSIIIKTEPTEILEGACGKFSAFLCCQWTLTISSVMLVSCLDLQARPPDPPVSWTSAPAVPQAL